MKATIQHTRLSKQAGTLVRRSNRTSADMRSLEFCYTNRGVSTQSFACLLKDFKVESEFHWKPVKGCKNRTYMCLVFVKSLAAALCTNWRKAMEDILYAREPWVTKGGRKLKRVLKSICYSCSYLQCKEEIRKYSCSPIMLGFFKTAEMNGAVFFTQQYVLLIRAIKKRGYVHLPQ